MSCRLEPVGSSRKLARAFVRVPWDVYAGDPNWVPPLTSAALRTMSRRKNPFHRHAETEHFVLTDGQEAVGRITATIYPAYLSQFGTKTGFFGFFESRNDPVYAETLLAGAETWLKFRGMEICGGPYNYCSTQEMGLLVDGFDQSPALFQTYNPPHYRGLLEGCGYQPRYTMSTFRWTLAQHGARLREISAGGQSALRKAGLTPRPIDRRRFRQESKLLHSLFNRSFADNADVLPYEEDVFLDMIRPLKPFLDERLISILERDGEALAFTVMIPNLNELLMQVQGSVGIRDLLRLKRYRREISSAVLLLIGAPPDVRGEGIGWGLVSEVYRSWINSDCESLHTTWINDANGASHTLAASLGAEPNKRYAIFERML